MNKLVNYLTEWGSNANKIVISIFLVNTILILIPSKIRRAIFFHTSLLGFGKYSFIIGASCLLIIIISIVKLRISRERSKRNRKYFS